MIHCVWVHDGLKGENLCSHLLMLSYFVFITAAVLFSIRTKSFTIKAPNVIETGKQNDMLKGFGDKLFIYFSGSIILRACQFHIICFRDSKNVVFQTRFKAIEHTAIR